MFPAPQPGPQHAPDPPEPSPEFTMPLRQQPFSARPRSPLRRALLWALRVVALLAAGYVLAVAVLGVVPRPREATPLPACCLLAPGERAAGAAQGPEPATEPGAGQDRNRGMQEGDAPDGPPVTIYVISNGVHADIVLPARVEGETGLAELLGLEGMADAAAYSAGQPRLTARTHLAVGWGAREFYLATPTWDEVRPGVALRALALAPAALHMDVMAGPPLADADTRVLRLARQGYRGLVTFVAASLLRDAAGRPMPIPAPANDGDGGGQGPGYGPDSLFYEATGRFSPVRTCNTWAADALAAAGARAPVWTPLPHFVLYHLPHTLK